MTRDRSEEHSSTETVALDVWLDFLTRHDTTNDAAFEQLCSRYPDLARALHLLRSEQGTPAFLINALQGRLKALASLSFRAARYHKRGEIARGGMGVVHKVFDVELDRSLALKEMAVRPAQAYSVAASRFLEEAQITAQLDHPGIVPVHEVGMDLEGRIYFAMKLVRGRDLRTILDLVRDNREGWNMTRALGVLLKICDAMAYAHSKGVIHRDLKPSNVMVGHFGEVYVMDWGLARVLGKADIHDVRIRPNLETEILTGRRSEREETPASPLVTMDGDVVGTPSYMSPEQARGDMQLISPCSDVYSVGAMLYQLLTGSAPFVPPGGRISSRAVLGRLLEGPPAPVYELNPEASQELVAICETAMSRDPTGRYQDTLRLGDDLQAFLERKVVRAYQTGAIAEARKWVERNKALASWAGLAVLSLIAGLTASLVLRAQSVRSARVARERADEVLRLSALQRLDDLIAEADRLWPAHPENVPKYEDWLRHAQLLVDELPRHEEQLARLRSKAVLHADDPRVQDTAVVGDSTPQVGPPSPSLVFADPSDKWWHGQLEKLVTQLRVLADEHTGLMSNGVSEEHGWGIRRRLEFAPLLEERSVTGLDAARRWAEAIDSIADVVKSPRYEGLRIEPQMGLLPIGQDPGSGLWEFVHLSTGQAPERGLDGRLMIDEETGIVLVLIPGGSFWMGASPDPKSPQNLDSQAAHPEQPVHAVTQSAHFISKYELTQGQWQRFTGQNPSFCKDTGGTSWKRYPVEQVSWIDCMRELPRMGLTLPSEAQWERCCRAGTDTPWWTGRDRESLRILSAANLADRAAARSSAPWPDISDWPELDDGFALTAPVGTFAENGFGLHDVHGNVWEWCLDCCDTEYYGRSPTHDPVAVVDGYRSRVLRGGCYKASAFFARASFRHSSTLSSSSMIIGARPARALSRRDRE